jgi:sulfur carrier protein
MTVGNRHTAMKFVEIDHAKNCTAYAGRVMRLSLNGRKEQVPDGLTVTGLLAHLAIVAPRVAVEVNGEVIARAQHQNHFLTEGDVVEVVTFVGGG